MSNHGSSLHASSIEGRHFRRVCGHFACGVTIATVLDERGAMHGMTASSFTSVSLDPPLVLICIGHNVRILEYFRQSAYFGINILNDCQRVLSERFAGKGYDRFEGVEWYHGQTGVPLLRGVLATLECFRTNMLPVGDHDILIGEVCHADCQDGQPLIHFGSEYRDLEAPPPRWIPA
jgi:flavin reductase (DIM6/NTAB) family NADH-FMN oxidoreductase RutF